MRSRKAPGHARARPDSAVFPGLLLLSERFGLTFNEQQVIKQGPKSHLAPVHPRPTERQVQLVDKVGVYLFRGCKQAGRDHLHSFPHSGQAEDPKHHRFAMTLRASARTLARRDAYASDQGAATSLVAVTARTNRQKADEDPAEWMLPARAILRSVPRSAGLLEDDSRRRSSTVAAALVGGEAWVRLEVHVESGAGEYAAAGGDGHGTRRAAVGDGERVSRQRAVRRPARRRARRCTPVVLRP